MKGLTVVFGSAVVVVVVSFVMSVVTAVREKHAIESTPRTIPTPAMGQ